VDADAQLLLQQIIGQQAQIAADMSAMRSDVTRALTRLELVDQRDQAAEQLHRDHEVRLRMLERFRYTMAGAALAGGVIAGFIGDLIGHATH
jgi:hypothetical protein